MPETNTRRGFITIATGNERYYKLAENLLTSYRFNCKNPFPFAVIADEENQYTAKFDDVIIIDNPSCSFMDKLRLYDLLPYDETIFIDADSLAFGDLNKWFSFFENQGDFSLFGYAHEDLNTNKGWFNYSGMKEYKKDIHFIPSFNGGVYYMKKTAACEKVFEIAKRCAEHYHEYSFNMFKDPADEPVLALGMTVCGFRPFEGGWGNELLFAPDERKLLIDTTCSEAFYEMDGRTVSPTLIHWGNYKTRKSLYRFEAEKLNKFVALNGRKSIAFKVLYDSKVRYYMLVPQDVMVFGGRVYRKLRKIVRRNGIK